VESAAEIDAGWLKNARVVGITAGASTPPEQIDAVAQAVRGIEI
jgi:4-hydroxy-3-methylbut-2-enyl diphosphate reductase